MNEKGDLLGQPPRPPSIQRWSAVLWPSFLFAGISITLFFAAVDPQTLLDCGGTRPIDRTTVYSVGFLICWVLFSACSAATAHLIGTRVPPSKRTETGNDVPL